MSSLEASIRNTKSRGEINTLRQNGKVPAIVYGGTEENQKVFVDEHVLHPDGETVVNIIMGSATPEQKDNYMPKLIQVQLTIDNKVRWINQDEVPHTVTPDSYDPEEITDPYSGEFGSIGVLMPGEEYEFLFTKAPPNGAWVITYHCHPHPWMTGTIEITKSRF